MRSSFLVQITAALRSLVLMTVLLGVVYPLVITGAAQALFDHRADGSLVRVSGRPVGSSLVGQPFTSPQYFHPRPSAVGYDGAGSGGSNLGPTNSTYLDDVAQRVADYRRENGLDDQVPVPVDAVTSSGSGLDPHISPANARLQAPRVARARGVEVAAVLRLVAAHTSHRPLGVLGDDAVDVLELNVALDELSGAS